MITVASTVTDIGLFTMTQQPSVPPMCLHKHSGQARVWLPGLDTHVYLGAWGTGEAQAEYDRVVGRYLGSGRSDGSITVKMLVDRFLKEDGKSYKTGENGHSHSRNIKYACAPLIEVCGSVPADQMKSRDLIQVREAMIAKGWVLNSINTQIRRIRSVFRWGIERGLVSGATLEELKAIRPLRPGRPDVKHKTRIKPVPLADIVAVQDRLRDIGRETSIRTADLIDLLIHTGMRIGEALKMHAPMLDTAKNPWMYKLDDHKTVHLTMEPKFIPLGPQAQDAIRPHLTLAGPIWRNRYGNAWNPSSVRKRIQLACDQVGIDRWHPHQLRHNTAVNTRIQGGQELSQAVLGHDSQVVNDIYSGQAKLEQAIEYARIHG